MAKPSRQKNPPTAVTNPNGWDASHGTYIAGRAHLDGVNALALQMQERWGQGRLRLLVSPELREKFDRQLYRVSAAILHGDLETLRQECARMCVAWRTLDREASRVGAEPINPEFWEVVLDDGTVAVIVKDNDAAFKVIADGRAKVVYTLDEIARLMSHHKDVARVKLQWPGATVAAVRRSIPSPLDAIRHAGSFDDPLDDLFHPQA